MSFSLNKALAWSVLLHLLMLLLFWFYDPPAPLHAPPKAIAAFVYHPIISKPIPAPTKPASQVLVAAKARTPTPNTAKVAPLSAPLARTVRPQVEHPVVVVQTDIPQTITPATTVVPALSQLSLAERSLALAAKRNTQLSSDTVQSLQQPPELRAHMQHDHNTMTQYKTTPDHVAANVQQVLPDGSFIEKIGDYCYQANDGANLRADIFSMKRVPCGDDKNAALYKSIMSKVGQNR